jgi:hypothetical protein
MNSGALPSAANDLGNAPSWPIKDDSGPGIGPLSGGIRALLCCRCGSETITSADRGDFQVQTRMFRVAAFIHHLQVSLMAGPDRDQHICLVMFSEVGTETALPVVN